MNLTNLIDAVRTRLGLPASDAFFSDQNITDLVNAGLGYVTGRHDWYWLETTESLITTGASESVVTDADSQRTIALYDSTGIQLEWMGLPDLVRIPADARSDTQRFFGYRGSTIILRPVPDAGGQSLTHIFRSSEPRLLTGTDTPLMPSQFHDAIADWACYFSHLRQGDLNGAGKWQESGEAWIQLMIASADRYADSVGGGARTEGSAGRETK